MAIDRISIGGMDAGGAECMVEAMGSPAAAARAIGAGQRHCTAIVRARLSIANRRNASMELRVALAMVAIRGQFRHHAEKQRCWILPG